MPLPVRKSYKGSPVTTSLTATLGVGSASCTVNSVTGWPTTFPFYVVIEPSTSREEKVRVTGITGTTLTIVRAQDNTIEVEHAAASTVYPVFTAIEADEANQIASAMTTKGDLITTDGSTINRLAVGATNTHVLQVDSTQTNGIKWGQVATAGIADSAVTSAKIADGTIVDGDINASAAIALSKLATGALPSGITVASANITDLTIATADIADSAVTSAKIADGTIVNGDISASAAIAHTKLANITAGSVLMGNASNAPTATALSGDVTVNSSGVTAIGSGVIVNADVSASAAIAHSKLANITAGQVLLGNASNVPTATALSGDVTVNSSGVTAISSGVIVAGDIATAVLKLLCPVGSISPYAGASAPTGWLLCDGTAINGSYTELIALVGANTPDMRGRFLYGKTAAGTGSSLLGTGGSTTIAEANLPSHAHTLASHTHTIDHDHAAGGSHSHTITISDPGHSHNYDEFSAFSNLVVNPSDSALSTGQLPLSQPTTLETTGITATASSSNVDLGNFTGNSGGPSTANTGSTGSGTAYLQPFTSVTYIIKHDY